MKTREEIQARINELETLRQAPIEELIVTQQTPFPPVALKAEINKEIEVLQWVLNENEQDTMIADLPRRSLSDFLDYILDPNTILLGGDEPIAFKVRD